ncbi:MAG: glycosyltransferase [Terracidiphilus sp.]|nr:glycosyltransferase [Terracidiphilus sp.]
MSHVAMLIPGLDRVGGAEQQVILLATGMRRRGWKVTVITLSGAGGRAADEFHAAGVAFLSLGMCKGLADPRGWIRFHRWLKQQAPDVVHAHLPHAAWLARWSRLVAPVPVLVDTLHSSYTGTLGRRLGYRWSNWLPDLVTAVSQAVADAHLSASMVTQEKLTVLPNGVDVEVWRPDATVRIAIRRELGLEKEFLWFAAGRLEPVKDYPTLLLAFARTLDDSRLVIAGSGPLQGELTRLTATLKLENRVRFLGFEQNVRRWMQAADGFVLSSRWEGLPMSLLEAAACALPTVATDVPGTREVIADGHTGWLVPGCDSTALGEAMNRMTQTPPEKRDAMGQKARRQVIERYSLGAVLDQWEALYQNLLNRTGTFRTGGNAAS